jgi:molybdenum cofactor cytidylyltransferase
VNIFVREIVAVIPAAGMGTRMGGRAKALLEVAPGETFLARIAATARSVGARRGLVVVGRPFAEQVTVAARALDLDIVENPTPELGMASSIAIGFARLAQTDADIGLLWPVDHPWIAASTVQAVIAALADRSDLDVVVPTHRGRSGHPPAVARKFFKALAACRDNREGARGAIRSFAVRAQMEFPDDPGVVTNANSVEDVPGSAA